MRELLNETQRVELSEFDKLKWIRKNPGILAHNERFVIGVWYYGIGSGRFKLSASKQGHTDDPELGDFREVLPGEKLLRGRVIDYEGMIVCVVYLDPANLSRLPETILLDLKFRCEQGLGKKIDYVLSDSGEVLLERCLLENCDIQFTEDISQSLFNQNFKDIYLEENKKLIGTVVSEVVQGSTVYVSREYLKTLETEAPETLIYLSKRLGA